MNEQEHPNGELPEVTPDHELQLPQPTPPVYAPPPAPGHPDFQNQPPQYAAPQQPQDQQPPVAQQPPAFQPPAAPVAPQYGQVPPYGQSPAYGHAPQYPGAPQQPDIGEYAQSPQAPDGKQYAQQVDPAQYVQQQYPAQQYPEGQQPYVTGQQQYAVGQQQYAPGAPPAGPTPRKGLPVGAWIGIGAGALVLLLLIISGIFVTTLLRSAAVPEPIPAPPITEELPEEDPGASDPLEVVTLDDVTNFKAGPYWGVPFESGWDIVRFDEQGVNEFSNAAVGCQFLTYQGYGPEGLTSTDDRGATEETLPTAMQIGLPWTAATADPTVTSDGSFEVPVDWTYNVEMQRFVAIYPSADGERQRQMLLRSFMPNNLALYAEVDCPATAAGNEAAQVILDGLTITEY